MWEHEFLVELQAQTVLGVSGPIGMAPPMIGEDGDIGAILSAAVGFWCTTNYCSCLGCISLQYAHWLCKRHQAIYLNHSGLETWRWFMLLASLWLDDTGLLLSDSEILDVLHLTMDDFDIGHFLKDGGNSLASSWVRHPNSPGCCGPSIIPFFWNCLFIVSVLNTAEFMRQTLVLVLQPSWGTEFQAWQIFFFFYCFSILLCHGEEQRENCLFNKHGRLTSNK